MCGAFRVSDNVTFCDNQRGHNTNDKTQPQSTDTLPGLFSRTILTPKRHQTLPHRQQRFPVKTAGIVELHRIHRKMALRRILLDASA